jgi:hypothetical protein
MNAFGRTRLVEAKGIAILRPYLDAQADGRLVMLDKGPLARALQETTGDCIFQCPKGRAWSVEIKVEQEETGNLFLESWSNRNLYDASQHIALGSNPGWFFKLRADLLLYYFLDTDTLFVLDFLRLKRWAFLDWRIARYPERPQSKYPQPNDAFGWCVPVEVLERALGPRHFRVLNPKKITAGFDVPEPLANPPPPSVVKTRSTAW